MGISGDSVAPVSLASDSHCPMSYFTHSRVKDVKANVPLGLMSCRRQSFNQLFKPLYWPLEVSLILPNVNYDPPCPSFSS